MNIKMKCGTILPLSEIEKSRLSYVPSDLQKPLVNYGHLWERKLPISLKTFKRSGIAAAWKMTGIQIFTGFPSNRRIGKMDFIYLNDIDIEAGLIQRYPDVYNTVRDLYLTSCEGTPCEIETKSGGRRLSAFTPYVGKKIAFKDSEGMLLEIFAFQGMSRVDHRYAMIQGSLLEIPTLPKSVLQEIHTLLSEIATQEQRGGTHKVVETSQIGDLDVNWVSYNGYLRSQLFPTERCPITNHASNRDEVRFTKYPDGAIGGICWNCGETWWEVEPQKKNALPTFGATFRPTFNSRFNPKARMQG